MTLPTSATSSTRSQISRATAGTALSAFLVLATLLRSAPAAAQSMPPTQDAVSPPQAQSPSTNQTAATPEREAAAATIGETPAATKGEAPAATIGKTPAATIGETPAATIGEAPAATIGEAPAATKGEAPAATKRTPSTSTAAFVEQPRATGYFVGDTVTQRVLLERNGQPLSPATLPKPGRASAWFERRAATVQTDGSLRRWLVIDYQILNAPPKLITVKLPAWSLAIKAAVGATPVALAVPEAKVNIAPLSPPGSPTQVGTSDLRPDHLPPVIETAPIRRSMEMSIGALVLTLMAWLAWIVWRNRRALQTQPFATALREMRALDEREPRAWQALHRAFDRTAGRVIQSATLPVLFERAPQLLPARGEIEQFFAQSSHVFFGNAQPAPISSSPSPRALCLELRRIEKRHEQ
jgi:mxaA protein